jgi:hypothetical protein
VEVPASRTVAHAADGFWSHRRGGEAVEDRIMAAREDETSVAHGQWLASNI